MDVPSTDTSPQASPCESPVLSARRRTQNITNSSNEFSSQINANNWSPQQEEGFNNSNPSNIKVSSQIIRMVKIYLPK